MRNDRRSQKARKLKEVPRKYCHPVKGTKAHNRNRKDSADLAW